MLTRIFPYPSNRRAWLITVVKLYGVALFSVVILGLIFWAIDSNSTIGDSLWLTFATFHGITFGDITPVRSISLDLWRNYSSE